MTRRPVQQRIDPRLLEVFKQFKNQGKVNTFPEFSRLIADEIRIKKKDLRFFK